jgi:hypothetical protein
MNAGATDFPPIWGLFVGTVMVVYAAVEGGYRLGNYRRRLAETEKEATIGPIVAATLGLSAFLMAFTFGLAASRFDARRHMVVTEANAIGTTYLRAGLLPEPPRAEIRRLLTEYVQVRLNAVETGDIDRGMAESSKLHDQLWAHSEKLAEADPHSITAGMFTQSLNEVIDLHSERLLIGVRNRLPIVLWATLYLVALLSMAELGYQEGVSGSRRTLAAPALVLAFSIVILLIADLDRPREGLIRVSQQAMVELLDSWKQSSGTRP